MQEITPSVLNSTSHTKPGQFPDELASPLSELFSKFLTTICASLTVEDPITGFGSLGRVSRGLVRWSPSEGRVYGVARSFLEIRFELEQKKVELGFFELFKHFTCLF